jgi:hypothetical protein
MQEVNQLNELIKVYFVQVKLNQDNITFTLFNKVLTGTRSGNEYNKKRNWISIGSEIL